MATIAHIMLKVECMIRKSIVGNHAFFAVVTFNKISSFAYINFIVIKHLQYLNPKRFHEDNLPFVTLQNHQHNFLNMQADNIF